MDKTEHFEALMAGFCRTIGIESLVLDEERGCTLAFDEQVVTVNYNEEEDSLWVFSDLGRISDEDTAGLYQELLTANFYRRQMGGAVLSYCEVTETIVLVLSRSLAGLEPAGMETLFQGFVDVAEAWSRRLGQYQPRSSDRLKGAAENKDKPGWLKI